MEILAAVIKMSCYEACCVFKTDLGLFELFRKTLGIWEPFNKQLMSCRRVGCKYDFMMLEIVLERHSDSQIPRNTEGGKKGNAVTVTVSQAILSALEDCGCTWRRFGASSGMPSTFQILSLDLIKKAARSAGKMPEECSVHPQQRAVFLSKGW